MIYSVLSRLMNEFLFLWFKKKIWFNKNESGRSGLTPELDFRLCGVYGDIFVLLGGTKGDVQHIYSNIHVYLTGSFLTVTCAFSQEALSDPSVWGGRSGRSNLPTCWGSCRNSHSRALPLASSGKCLRSSSMRLEMQSASLLHFLSLDKKRTP